MRVIFIIIQKEFLQIFRNKAMLPIIFVVPIVQLFVLVHAATMDMKSIEMVIADRDCSNSSRGLIAHFSGSPFYKIVNTAVSEKEASADITKGTADVALIIPAGFEKSLITQGNAKVQLLVDAINGTSAGLISAYSRQIIAQYNSEIIMGENSMKGGIQTEYSFWYNPEMNYKTFMVPGILVLLVTIIGLMLSAMNIVREKELGTIEQINATPVKKYQFIAGKLIPFWLLALFELAFGLAFGKLVFDIPMLGSLWLVFACAMIYLIVVLGAGLFMSTITNTQQQAMLLSFFFMIVFIMMSGLFTSVESMPDWAQEFNRINPVAYFIKIMRGILLKGAGLKDIMQEIISLAVLGLALISLAVWRYRKTT